MVRKGVFRPQECVPFKTIKVTGFSGWPGGHNIKLVLLKKGRIAFKRKC